MMVLSLSSSILAAAPLEDWLKGNWRSAALDPITGLIGDGLFAMFLGGSILLSFYLAGRGDLVAPVSVLMIFSFLLVPALPASMAGIAYSIALVGLAGGMLAVGRRYVLE